MQSFVAVQRCAVVERTKTAEIAAGELVLRQRPVCCETPPDELLALRKSR